MSLLNWLPIDLSSIYVTKHSQL